MSKNRGRDSGKERRPKIEAQVRQGGRVVSTLSLERFPAVIGRSPDADIRLDSQHVSRTHAQVYLSEGGLRVVDAGSSNGFSVGGRKHREAEIELGDVLEVCDFEIVFKQANPSGARSAPARATNEAGRDSWDDYLSLDGDSGSEPTSDTRVGPRPKAKPKPVSNEVTRDKAPDAPRDSLLNRLAFKGEDLARNLGDVDDDDTEAARQPDVPPLIVSLHQEANKLLYSDPYLEVVVEVVKVGGGLIHDLTQLGAGDSYWWGGKPNALTQLWVTPTATRFPLVVHDKLGEFRTYVPAAPRWKMFHRGQRELDVHRFGPLLGAGGEPGDQIELTYGPVSYYVRVVRRQPRPLFRRGWKHLRPSLAGTFALLFALLSHAVFVALPQGKFDPDIGLMALQEEHWAEARVILPELTSPPEPSAAAEVAAPPDNPTATDVDKPPAPPSEPTPEAKPLRVRQRPRPMTPVPNTPPPEDSAEPPAAPPPPVSALSVADFKVAGTLGALPALDVPRQSQARPGLGSLSGGPSQGMALGRGMPLVTPKGTLATEDVARVVKQHSGEVARCYHKALDGNSGLEGQIDVQWVVDRRGRASAVKVVYDGVGSPPLNRCLTQLIGEWDFPKPEGGPASVSYPFRFVNPRF